MVQPLWKTIWRFLKKLNRITIWSSNSTSGYISKRIDSRVSKKYLYTHVHSSIHKSQKVETGTSLVAQWLRIHLPVQGTRVRALVREDPTCRGATKPACHNY